jgi:hypothetical protein
MDRLIMKHRKEFAAALRAGKFEITKDGLVFPNQQVGVKGTYFIGEENEESGNILPDESLIAMLNTQFGASAKPAAWYIALFSGAITPIAGWTAANFSANSSEIISTTEGYSQATRPQYTPAVAAADAIDNLASKATFTIACTTSVVITGAALLSSNVRGGTAGILGSATRFANARTQYNADPFQIGYVVTLNS